MLRWTSIIILLLPLFGRCQSIDETLEWLADQNPEQITSLDQIANDLIFFAEHHIDLNTANFYQLRQLHLLSDYQIAAILHYRERYGDLLSIYELKYIDRLDMETIRHILPFVMVQLKDEAPDTSIAQVARNIRHEVISRWSFTNRPPGKDHLGSPHKLYTRYTIRYKDKIRAGYTVEKDAGEQGADFQSFHIAMRSKRSEIILGDFHVDLGQGLMTSTGFRMSGISSANQTIAFGTKPYTSVGEINYFRGGSVRTTVGQAGNSRLTLMAFGSSRKIDATLDTLDSGIEISSDNSTGLHRNPNEVARRKVTRLSHAGFDIERKTTRWKVNLHGIHGRYEHPLRLNDRTYEQYRFTGRQYSNAGLSHFVQLKHGALSGEVVVDQNGVPAIVESIRFMPDAYSKLNLKVWHLPHTFHAPMGVNPDGSSNAQNSTGGSLILRGKLFPRWSFASYLERTRSPWLKYRVDGPSMDQAEQVYLHWTPGRDFRGYIMFRHRAKTMNDGHKEGVNDLKRVNSYNLRFHFDRRPNDRVAINCRIAISKVKQDSIWTTGWLGFFGASYSSPDRRWDIKSRITLFDTETFESRIYAYEQQARGMFSVPMFNGSGSRFYAMAKYKPSRHVNVWVRFAQWLYSWDRQSPWMPTPDREVFVQTVIRL